MDLVKFKTFTKFFGVKAGPTAKEAASSLMGGLSDMVLNTVESLPADHMLNAAGIGNSGLLRNP